jgi:hypothetical protein
VAEKYMSHFTATACGGIYIFHYLCRTFQASFMVYRYNRNIILLTGTGTVAAADATATTTARTRRTFMVLLCKSE